MLGQEHSYITHCLMVSHGTRQCTLCACAALLLHVPMSLHSNVSLCTSSQPTSRCQSLPCAVQAKYIRIDGDTPQTKRAQLVDAFQEDSDVKVAVLGLKACCTGLTLHAASTVVFAETYWVPGIVLQAEDRVHRVGQVHRPLSAAGAASVLHLCVVTL